MNCFSKAAGILNEEKIKGKCSRENASEIWVSPFEIKLRGIDSDRQAAMPLIA